MVPVNNIRPGHFIKVDSRLYQALSYNHIKMGRGGAIIKFKLKDLANGAIIDQSFKNTESVEEASVRRFRIQFLYQDSASCHFMDESTYEEYGVPLEVIGSSCKLLKDNMIVQAIMHDDQIINIELPIKEVYQVIEAPPGNKGDTASGGSKKVIIETGAAITAPLFIKTGDRIRINTLESSYVERVSD